MKNRKHFTILATALMLIAICFAACEDDTEKIGGSLRPSEVGIQVDSLFTISGRSVYAPVFDAKSPTQLIGHLNVPEYGDLECSFVTQLLSSVMLNVPEDVTSADVDSMKLRLRFANGNLTGDSLAPQQLKIYALNKQLPSPITNEFDPTGYYDVDSPLGVRPYTGSALGMNDSVFKNKNMFRAINVKMPLQMARKIFNDYRTNPSVFQTVPSFNSYFPGLYAEHSFGTGMVVNITSTDMIAYYHRKGKKNVTQNGVVVQIDTIVTDSIILFNVSPEVVSSNRIKLKPAQSLLSRIQNGDHVLLSPAGYNVEVNFPTRAIVSRYKSTHFNLAVINNLTMSIPVEEISNSYDIGPAPFLLMVRKEKISDFFANNEIPDQETSFYATYNTKTRSYDFTSMRNYIIAMMAKDKIEDSDTEFVLAPVYITTEKNNDYDNTVSVTKCVPYILRPSMCVLKLSDAKIRFTFSTQNI